MGYGTDNNLMPEMEDRKASVASPIQFRHGIMESQKRTNYHNEFDRLQGATKT